MKRAAPRRRDIEMRRQPSVWIDLVRRKGKDGSVDIRLGGSLEASEEEPHVGRHRLDVGVRWNHEDGRGGARCRRDVERLHRPRQAGDNPARRTQTCTAGSRLEQCTESERARGGTHWSRSDWALEPAILTPVVRRQVRRGEAPGCARRAASSSDPRRSGSERRGRRSIERSRDQRWHRRPSPLPSRAHPAEGWQ